MPLMCIAFNVIADKVINKLRYFSGFFSNHCMMIHYPSHYLMGTHEEPDSFINSLLIMKKRGMLFALLFYCFSALQLSVYC